MPTSTPDPARASYWCVVPAAGAGRRFGRGLPKQYEALLGRPMLLRTLERVASHPRIAGLMVALAGDDAYWPGITACEGKPVLTCVGGGERADSVLAGLKALPPGCSDRDFVLVHDAARPCVRHRDLDRLIEAATRHAVGALLALPVSDTLKRADAAHEVEATVSRSGLWRAQTPQMFRRAELVAALERAARAGQDLTDDAAAFELVGKKPLLVEGCADNLKITTRADLALAAAVLEQQRAAAVDL